MVLDGPQRLRGQIVSPFSMVLSIQVFLIFCTSTLLLLSRFVADAST